MKRMLNISGVMSFDHDKPNLSAAMSADYREAVRLVEKTQKMPKASQAIEKLLFDNNANLQTRILAVFIAGRTGGDATGDTVIIKRGRL